MNKQKPLLVFTIIFLAFSSCVNVFHHDQDLAAAKTVEFAKAAFVERNFEKASKALPIRRQNPNSVKQVEDIVTKMHPSSYPEFVTATEYEPVPGQKVIRIFLIGENDQNEKFYYAVILEGTVDEGYSVVECYRSPEPLPSSGTRKPLPTQRSTDGYYPTDAA